MKPTQTGRRGQRPGRIRKDLRSKRPIWWASVPRDALAPHTGSGPARRPGMIYGASALKLADGGTIKWLFMFQRRVFTVRKGGELF